MKVSIKQLAVLTLVSIIAFPAWAGDYTSINSAIRVGAGTSANDVESVNGSIRIGDESVVRSVSSVNGSIKIGQDVTIEHRVEAVNGSVSLKSGSRVGDGVETVNGAIHLHGTHVAGDINTINGGISLLDGTVVTGDVVVRKPKRVGWKFGRKKPIPVEIGGDAEVHGKLIFEQAVELRVHPGATYGEVIGGEVTVVEL